MIEFFEDKLCGILCKLWKMIQEEETEGATMIFALQEAFRRWKFNTFLPGESTR
jgi:hypothetical protein